jgi:hypothetical protein
MELFAPENLPGVGMGDLDSIAAVCGLLGLAVTSGVLVAQGWIGSLVFGASAVVLLQEKHDWGRSPEALGIVLVVLVLSLLARTLLTKAARRETAALAGTAKDDPEVRARAAAIGRREAWVQRMAILGVIWAGAVVGFAWAEWDEVPFVLRDLESGVGLGLGLVAGAIGGDAAWRFLQGALRAGGSSVIVGTVVTFVAFALSAFSVYVPFVGAVVFVLAAVLATRLRRRQQQKYAGLRILS